MIHARFATNGKPIVYLDGIQVYALEVNVGPVNYAFILKRVSLLRFALVSKLGIHIDIRMFDRYLDVHMHVADNSYCTNGQGLWGNCNNKPFDDFANSSSQERIPDQAYIHEVFGLSWKVLPINSLFKYNLNEYHEERDLSGGGYSLLFNNTGIQTGEIYSFSSSDITIEFMIKLIGKSGTVISYTTTETFAVTITSGTVKLQYADTTLETLVGPQIGKWNHISIVWSRANKIVQFYLIDENGVQSRNFPIANEVNIFEPGGILALGYWRPSPTGRGRAPSEGFVGELDELRIWNKKLDPQTISSNWKLNLNCRHSLDLASLWKFNEGQGNIAKDCVSTAHIILPSSIWRPPTWVYSTAPISPFSVDIAKSYSLRFDILLPYADVDRKCTEVVLRSDIRSSCPKLTSSLLMFYYSVCLTTVSRTGNLDSAYWVMLVASDFCTFIEPSRPWYAKNLCKQVTRYNFPEWVGSSCERYCQFGLQHTSKADSCECEHGFYGTNCSNECPGGYNRPCNGLASCNPKTGTCNCPINANASSDCTKCLSGWTGKDCSVAVANITTNASIKISYCQGYGVSHYTTFDGAAFNFGTSGEFYAVKTVDFEVQIRQTLCGNGSFCITSLAVRAGLTNVTIRAALNNSGSERVWINRVLTKAASVKLNKTFVYIKTSPSTFEVSNNLTLGNKTLLRVKTWKKYLSFEIIAEAKLCKKATGLCSSCDGNVENDFIDSNGTTFWGKNATQDLIIRKLTSQWSVRVSDSMFIYDSTTYHEKRDVTTSGYCLQFKGSVTKSMNVRFNRVKDLTLQLFVKVSAVGGTIMSYATTNTFALVNDATIKIYLGANVFDTAGVLQLNSWYQISIVYQRLAGKDKIKVITF